MGPRSCRVAILGKGIKVGHTAYETTARFPLVTDKVRKLFVILVRMSKSTTFSGIVFVQERALFSKTS
jgi:hypothetical protein